MRNHDVRAVRTLSRATCALVLLGASLSSTSRPVQAQEMILSNGRFVDPATESVHGGHVLVRDGLVVGLVAEPPPGFQGDVVDLGGDWVIPGLHDLHTHSFGNTGPGGASQFAGVPGVSNLMLYSGVIAFLDLFSMEDQILPARDRQREQGGPGADILAAGPCLTATGGHCSEYGVPTRIVDSPTDAEREVAELAIKRPDVVKIVYDHRSSMPTVDEATLAATVATAREHGIPTVVHVGTWQDVADAVEAGAAAVTHTPPGPPPEDLPGRMAAAGTAIIPTLVVQTEISRIAERPELLDDPLLVATSTAALRDAYRDPGAWDDRTNGFVQWQMNARDVLGPSVKALHEAGVTILTGTDAGNLGVFQGYSLHRELALLVEAGLTEWQALAASSTNVAALLGRSTGFRAGDVASFVVLSASPLDDIGNSRRIKLVIRRGRVVDRDGLL